MYFRIWHKLKEIKRFFHFFYICRNKHIERELHAKCKEKFRLNHLTKDDSIDPNRMIECLERLLNSEHQLQISNCVLHITHYYSVLSDGTICIPWDWKLE